MKSRSKLIEYSKDQLFAIDIAFYEFNAYQTMIEKFLLQEQLRLEEKIKEFEVDKNKKLPGYSDFLLTKLIEDHVSLSNLYTHNFRASFYIQIISFIEYELRNICEYHHVIKKTDFGIEDLKGSNDIDKAKIYLSKSANIKFKNLNPEWQFIQEAKEIRNLLVHHQSRVIIKNKRNERLKSVFQEKDYFEYHKFPSENSEGFEEGHFFICKSEANRRLIDSSKIFFTKLLESELKIL